MTKRYFFWITLMAFAILSSCTAGKKTAITNDGRLDDALLWKIEGNGLAEPSYLFGTIHLIGKEDFFYPDGLLSAVDQVDRITFEIDMADLMDISKQMSLMSKAFMRDNLTLKDLISKEDYQLVKDHFDKIGIPLFFLERMQPMFLSVFGYGDINPGDLQSGEMKSYELELNELAQQQHKQTGGLETIEYQLSAIDSIPYEQQADILVKTIKDGDAGTAQMELMTELYTGQKIDDMYTEVGDDSQNSEAFERILLTNRNRNWIPVMEGMMDDKPTLFAVGAGHLGGPEGVVRLLRKKGFTLTPVSQKKS